MAHMIKVIADPGSCHMGDINRAIALTRAAVECGVDAIKWQLFDSSDGGNVPLAREYFFRLVEIGRGLGIEVFASVWKMSGLIDLKETDCKSIKFAYSQNNRSDLIGLALERDMKTYVSGDIQTDFPKGKATDRTYNCPIRLYCIPLYPVPYLIDFDGLFPRFDGFSSHCLGIEQDKAAIRAGAKIIEKHFQLDDVSACPDGNFAIRPAKLKELCDYAHTYERLME
jgi:sialic acid synthase SpsE